AWRERRHCPERGGVTGGQEKPLLELLQGAGVVQRNPPFVVAQGQVPFRAVRCKRDGLLRRLPSALRERRCRRAVEVQKRSGDRDSRPGLSEAGIQRDRLLEEADLLAYADGIGGSAVPDLLALQEGVVGCEVLRGLLGEPLLLACPERGAQSLRHVRGDVCLNLEDVRQVRVEGLLPFR